MKYTVCCIDITRYECNIVYASCYRRCLLSLRVFANLHRCIMATFNLFVRMFSFAYLTSNLGSGNTEPGVTKSRFALLPQLENHCS